MNEMNGTSTVVLEPEWESKGREKKNDEYKQRTPKGVIEK